MHRKLFSLGAALLVALFVAAPARAEGSPNPQPPAQAICWLSVEKPQGLDSRIHFPDDPVQVYGKELPMKAIGLNGDSTIGGATEVVPGATEVPWMFFSAHKTPHPGKVTAPFRDLNQVPIGASVWVSLCDGTVLEYRVTDSFALPTLDAWAKVWAHRQPDTLTLYGCEGCGLWHNPRNPARVVNDCEAKVPRGWTLFDRFQKRVLFAKRVR